MSRPTLVDITSLLEAWDVESNKNTKIQRDGPLPIHEHVGDETDLESTFAAAAHDRCLVWVDHTVVGWTLYYSDGTDWISFGEESRSTTSLTTTTTQVAADKFVRYTGAGSVDYDFLAAASWAGRTVEVRNDASAAINLDPNGSEEINEGGAGTPLSLAAGSTARVYSDGTELFASVAL